jgi:hypothetical protein
MINVNYIHLILYVLTLGFHTYLTLDLFVWFSELRPIISPKQVGPYKGETLCFLGLIYRNFVYYLDELQD